MSSEYSKKISNYWYGSTFLFLLVSFCISGYIFSTLKNIKNLNDVQAIVFEVQLLNQNSISDSKDFLLNAYSDHTFVFEGRNKSYESYFKYSNKIKNLLNTLVKNEEIENLGLKKSIEDLKKIQNEFNQFFLNISVCIKEKGFKDVGIEGSMRNKIHMIEKNPLISDKSFILTLRRHEKDFLLRKDVEYIKKFESSFLEFEDFIINNIKADQPSKDELLLALNDYRMFFFAIVKLEKKIGLNENLGLRQELNKSITRMDRIVGSLSQELTLEKIKAEEQINFILVLFVFLVIGLFTVIIWLKKYFFSQVLRPLNDLNQLSNKISAGNISINTKVLSYHPILSDLIQSYENTIDKMKFMLSQINALANRESIQLIEVSNQEDEVSMTLNNIISKIIQIENSEKIKFWMSEGHIKISNISRKSENINELCTIVLKEVIEYLKINQGCIWVAKIDKNSTTTLELESTYAYNRKKYITGVLDPGQGILGQCFLEKKTVIMNKIPNDYLKVTSGLGEANPSYLIIIPMMIHDKVEALIELASFKKFEDFEIEWLEEIGESLAVTIASLKSKAYTNMLLEESKIKTENLLLQEENLRQSLEELNAIQDAMRVNEVELTSIAPLRELSLSLHQHKNNN